jgi:hypothetical protein
LEDVGFKVLAKDVGSSGASPGKVVGDGNMWEKQQEDTNNCRRNKQRYSKAFAEIPPNTESQLKRSETN